MNPIHDLPETPATAAPGAAPNAAPGTGNGATDPAARSPQAGATEADLQGAAGANGAAGSTADTPAVDAPALGPEQQLAALQARVAELQDAQLRARAEAENARRRAEEEVAKARKFAVEGFAEALLPVRDSLEAALAIPNATREQLLEGSEATLRQLAAALERQRVLPIAPPAGTRFDPHQHQAISVVPAEQDANTVVAVLQKGYLIAERVLRPALVTVAAPK